MEALKFKTNINCENCLKRVKPFLDKVEGVKSWSVDTQSADKILTVELGTASEEQIVDAVSKVGFDIAKI